MPTNKSIQTLALSLSLVPSGLTPVSVFPPFNTPRTFPAIGVIFFDCVDCVEALPVYDYDNHYDLTYALAAQHATQAAADALAAQQATQAAADAQATADQAARDQAARDQAVVAPAPAPAPATPPPQQQTPPTAQPTRPSRPTNPTRGTPRSTNRPTTVRPIIAKQPTTTLPVYINGNQPTPAINPIYNYNYRVISTSATVPPYGASYPRKPSTRLLFSGY